MSVNWLEVLLSVYQGFMLLLIGYVIAVSLFYLASLVVSAKQLYRTKGVEEIQYDEVLNAALAPPLSILVPAYNEELNIISSVRSLLSIQYTAFEVIVINDGSKDATAACMIEEFDMFKIEHKIHWSGLKRETKPIESMYRSKQHPNLVLVNKVNGGKADALNVGINVSQYPYFVSLDGDSVLESSAFMKIMKPIMNAKPGEEIIASGGSVGIANGSMVESGRLRGEDVVLSRRPLVVMQVIEYLRAFLMGRIALSQYNLLLIVSGAFGVFRKDWVIEAGGYEVGTIGEDMELIVRLHRMIKEKKSKAKIVYIPDPVCWTEAPEDLKVLRRQRIRWQRGLFESLWKHKKMIANPRYGPIGFIAMPYYTFVELLGPLVEFVGMLSVIIGFFLDEIYVLYSIILAACMILYGSLLSMGSVLFEEWSYKRYNKVSDLSRLFVYALSESFWYRPILTYWRLEGLLQAWSGKQHTWGDMMRKGSVAGSKTKRN